MTDTNFAAREQNTGSGNAHLAVDGQAVSESNPVPVAALELPASGRAPVAGQFTAAGQSSPFTPAAGRAFNITISGAFSGSIRLVRSFDAGENWHPLTADGNPLMVFSVPVSEQWSDPEAGVLYRLEATSLTFGAANYRISQ